MKRTLFGFCFVVAALTLSSCGGGDSSSDSGDQPIYMGGVWRGNFTLSKNDCGLDLTPSYNFTHMVGQYDTAITLEDEEHMFFEGNVVGDNGFSVDHPGPGGYRIPDGRVCDFTYRYRYGSINDDGDRTAQVRFLYVASCRDGSSCESEYEGDGLRD